MGPVNESRASTLPSAPLHLNIRTASTNKWKNHISSSKVAFPDVAAPVLTLPTLSPAVSSTAHFLRCSVSPPQIPRMKIPKRLVKTAAKETIPPCFEIASCYSATHSLIASTLQLWLDLWWGMLLMRWGILRHPSRYPQRNRPFEASRCSLFSV